MQEGDRTGGITRQAWRARLWVLLFAPMMAACTTLVGLSDLPAQTTADDASSFDASARNPKDASARGVDATAGMLEAASSDDDATNAFTRDAATSVGAGGNGARDALPPPNDGSAGTGGTGGQMVVGSGGATGQGVAGSGGTGGAGGQGGAGEQTGATGGGGTGGQAGATGSGGTGGQGGATGTGGTGGQAGSGGASVGGCAQECPTRQTCVNGACQCRNTLETACGADCVYFDTDKAHCGSCTKTCADACSAGRCINVLFQPTDTTTNALAVDNTNLYWASKETGQVFQTPKVGGATKTVATGQDVPLSIAVDSNNLYWANAGTGSNPGKIMKKSLSTSTLTVLADNEGPRIIAIDAANVYWTNYSVIRKIPLAGGTAVTLASSDKIGNTLDLTVNSGFVYFTNGSTDGIPSSVMKVPGAGGTLTTLATDPTAYYTVIRVNSAGIFLDNLNIFKLPLAGGTVAPFYSFQGGLVTAFAIDDTSLYLASTFKGIVKVPAAGGTAQILVGSESAGDVSSIVVDATSVYWSAYGTILSTSKIP